jgi:hypothetical protein
MYSRGSSLREGGGEAKTAGGKSWPKAAAAVSILFTSIAYTTRVCQSRPCPSSTGSSQNRPSPRAKHRRRGMTSSEPFCRSARGRARGAGCEKSSWRPPSCRRTLRAPTLDRQKSADEHRLAALEKVARQSNTESVTAASPPAENATVNKVLCYECGWNHFALPLDDIDGQLLRELIGCKQLNPLLVARFPHYHPAQ